MCIYCSIVPSSVLLKLSKDKSLTAEERKGFADTEKLDVELRKVRTQARKLTQVSSALSPAVVGLAGPPTVTVYDCNHSQTLPGSPAANPGSSPDITARQAFNTTTQVAKFYEDVFARSSVDNAGMTLMSSIHYGTKYNNAFWNGFQMTYGDGDGNIFIDFSNGNDVIGHELTHGVTQHSMQLAYANEPGGLNEGMSDIFGSMFRQWMAKQDVKSADWLIGKDIMGEGAKSKGYTCLRDMADPAAAHALAPQPKHFSKYKKGMDPHESSGIPNFAFYKAAMAIGGNSWEKTGQIWYNSMTRFAPSPNMKMLGFANRTRTVAAQLFSGNATILGAVDQAWKQVGL